jgi:hypoxanthine phosphoribosyltransferase
MNDKANLDNTARRQQALSILAQSDLLVDAMGVQAAIDALACAICSRLDQAYPVVLTVMGGGVFLAGQLLPRLTFPLECDYLQVSRYNDSTRGGAIHWLATPRTALAGRDVLVLDDILDEGITLAGVRENILSQGASACHLAVLCEKELPREKPVCANFTGLMVPNRYLFGCGMDVYGLWRNLPEIRALRQT